MKPTGMFELVLIVTVLIAGLPLFISCYSMAYNGLGLVYMDDKSTWKVSDDVEYVVIDGTMVPSIIGPTSLNEAQAAVLPYVQDEFTPNIARSINYNYDAATIIDNDLTGANEFNVTIPNDKRASRYIDNDIVTKVMPKDKVDEMKAKKWYIVWNYDTDSWTVTNKYLYIY